MADEGVRLGEQLEEVVCRFQRTNCLQPHGRWLFRVEESAGVLTLLRQRTHRHRANGDNGILASDAVQVELLVASIEQCRQAGGSSANVLAAELFVEVRTSFLMARQLAGRGFAQWTMST